MPQLEAPRAAMTRQGDSASLRARVRRTCKSAGPCAAMLLASHDCNSARGVGAA